MISQRPTLDQLNLPTGKRTRLHRLLHHFGPGNGTLMLLPVDQGLEHGPVDFFENPESLDPNFQLCLARDGGFSGIVFHIGIAQKYMAEYAGVVPLVLKINGKTNVPSEEEAFSPLDAAVEEAVRLGAEAVGYTLYVGSPRQVDDIAQLTRVRQDCEQFGMPLIVWAYPRGKALDARGGRDTLYAIDYAARVGQELGADVIKINMPDLDPENHKRTPKEYAQRTWTEEEAVRKVIASAGRAMVLFSGGAKVGDAALLQKADMVMRAGATGLIFGRNMWQRPMEQALAMSAKIRDIMLKT